MTKKQAASQESDLPEKLASPARRALSGAGYSRLEQLTRITEAELAQLREALAAKGLSFAEEKSRA